MINTLAGLAGIVLMWFLVPLLIAPCALACCLLLGFSPRRRRSAGRRPATRQATRIDVHRIPAQHPTDVHLDRRPDGCTAAAA